LEKWVTEKGPSLKLIVLNAKAINGLDSSAVHVLHDITQHYKNKGIDLFVCGLKGPIRDVMYRSGLTEFIGESNFFFDIPDAINHYREGAARVDSKIVMQTNSGNSHG